MAVDAFFYSIATALKEAERSPAFFLFSAVSAWLTVAPYTKERFSDVSGSLEAPGSDDNAPNKQRYRRIPLLWL